MLCSIPLLSQNGTVTGSVSDSETNEPLPGVNVVVKNTTKGTNTDFDGNFSIEGVSSGDVLVFSYIGYKSQEISVGDSSPTTCIFNFALGPNFIAAFLLPIFIERFAGFLLKTDKTPLFCSCLLYTSDAADD